ncbi:MAG TPA: alpha/beta fold hydrolase [Candidatus Thermoplasmatota archaeon]|nr:alpha/beta fold hydrolase [Candidatus Thermoplasmatota archaeon]
MTDAVTDDRRWEALRERLEALPQTPVARAHPRNWVFRVKRGLDFIGHIRIDSARFFARHNPYPKPFKHLVIPLDEGVEIGAWLGPQHRVRTEWGMVIVPGLFSTKDDTVHKRRAIRIWRQWRIPVLAMDMRGFGESTGISTAGWKEADDVHAAVRTLKAQTGVKRVAVMAESLGGAAALNALAYDGESGTNLMTGGVLCWSPFVDARDAVGYISERPPKDHPFFASWEGFRRLLRFKSMGGYDRFDEYLEDAARVHGLSGFSELCDLSNPKWKVPMMRHPTLLVHATDDPVVPVRHARRMERYSEGHPHIETLITTWGEHTGFEPMDPTWFWDVMRIFFGEVNGVELPNLANERLLKP